MFGVSYVSFFLLAYVTIFRGSQFQIYFGPFHVYASWLTSFFTKPLGMRFFLSYKRGALGLCLSQNEVQTLRRGGGTQGKPWRADSAEVL